MKRSELNYKLLPKGGVNLNSNANKTERFLEAINSDAEARCGKIKKDVDEYIDNELQKARRLAHQNVRPVRSSEIDRLNEKINAELSETETKEIEKLVAIKSPKRYLPMRLRESRLLQRATNITILL